MMTESAKIVWHMDRLAEHVNRRLKTADTFEWMLTRVYPDDAGFPVDVREALTKLKKLDYRYNQLWKQRNGVLRTDESGIDSNSVLKMHNYSASERKWVIRMWRKGDWAVRRDRDDGTEWTLRAFEEGKFRWRPASRQSG